VPAVPAGRAAALLAAAIAGRAFSSRLALHPAGHMQIEKRIAADGEAGHGHRNCTKAFSPSIDRLVAFFSCKEAVMNWDTVKGNWKQYRGKVQEAYGISKDEAEQQIQGFENRSLN